MRVLCVPLLLIGCTPALAYDRAFVGTWGETMQVCAAQDGRTFEIRAKAIQMPSADCSAKQEMHSRNGWHAQFLCSAQPNSACSVDLVWRLRPNGHLVETRNSKTYTYVRCRSSGRTG